MIEFIRTRDDPRYLQDSLAINVTHTISESVAKEILTSAIEVYGIDWVKQLLPMDHESSKKYMVSVDGASAPRQAHNSYLDAEAEAKRILRGCTRPSTARVLKVVATFATKIETKVSIEKEKP